LRITDASRSVLLDKHPRVNATKSPQVPVRLALSVFVDDIGQRNTANWPEPAPGIADRQEGIRVHAGRQLKIGLRFFLDCKYSVVNVAPRPSALAARSMF
jgi:hypothetical protein